MTHPIITIVAVLCKLATLVNVCLSRHQSMTVIHAYKQAFDDQMHALNQDKDRLSQAWQYYAQHATNPELSDEQRTHAYQMTKDISTELQVIYDCQQRCQSQLYQALQAHTDKPELLDKLMSSAKRAGASDTVM